ncbi:hypothetical protein PUN28_008520 [Cardiocondyla obscurior]|uniref:Secreted protein n=1 Tax=Cardiocondyla obscurior TaxID=286306 RepID=A0AAW2G025_9HYME
MRKKKGRVHSVCLLYLILLIYIDRLIVQERERVAGRILSPTPRLYGLNQSNAEYDLLTYQFLYQLSFVLKIRLSICRRRISSHTCSHFAIYPEIIIPWLSNIND